MFTSLQTRLLLAVGLLALAAIALVALAARQSTRVEFDRFQAVERLRSSDEPVRATLDRVADALNQRCCDPDSLAATRPLLEAHQALLVLDDGGGIVAAQGFQVGAAGLRATLNGDALELSGRNNQPGSMAGISIVFHGGPVVPIRLADGRSATVRIVTLPEDRAQPAAQFLGSIDRRLILAVAVVAVLALGVSWAVTRRIIRPIAELRDAARDLGRGQLSRRVDAPGRDEIADLGRSFNAMAAELERQQGLRRNLVSDVTHELRRPLTALRCRMETVMDGLAADPRRALAEMSEEVSHLTQLVSDLEELARAESGEMALSLGDVALPDVCESAIRAAGLEGDRRLGLELDARAIAHADATRVRQIVLNLLTNADRHTPATGTITVRARIDDDRAILDVHNSGSAIAREDLDRIFDRFYRADPSRQRATGGHGLGLAIVKNLTEAQGGQVRAASDAGGVTVTVSLPRTNAEV
jgi:signal transduction histidine kinase